MKKFVSIIAVLLFVGVAGNALAANVDSLNLNIYERTDGGNEINVNLFEDITALDGTQNFVYNIDLNDFLTDDCAELFVVCGGDVLFTASPEYIGIIDTIDVNTLNPDVVSLQNAYLLNGSLNAEVTGTQVTYSNAEANAFAQIGGNQGGVVSSALIPFSITGEGSYTFNIYERTTTSIPFPPFTQTNTLDPTPVATITVVCGTTAVIPVPGALLLMASGLIGLVSLRKKNA